MVKDEWQALILVNGNARGWFPETPQFPCIDPFTPMVCARKYETFHNFNLPGSGAAFTIRQEEAFILQ